MKKSNCLFEQTQLQIMKKVFLTAQKSGEMEVFVAVGSTLDDYLQKKYQTDEESIKIHPLHQLV